jgi:hypothetical protein
MNNDQIIARIQEGLAQAQRGEFVSDEEMEEYFAQHTDNSVDTLWANECIRRASLIDEGSMQLIDADEVMNKYRKYL